MVGRWKARALRLGNFTQSGSFSKRKKKTEAEAQQRSYIPHEADADSMLVHGAVRLAADARIDLDGLTRIVISLRAEPSRGF